MQVGAGLSHEAWEVRLSDELAEAALGGGWVVGLQGSVPVSYEDRVAGQSCMESRVMPLLASATDKGIMQTCTAECL